jgi:ABC-type multidrug transport system fused ATPase/permease subunit
MQFTIIVEFLLPGLAIVLLALPLLPADGVPAFSKYLSGSGETTAALLLLAVSYPVGILTNFPIYVLLQAKLISPQARRKVIKTYLQNGIDLSALVQERFGITLTVDGKAHPVDARHLFQLMRAAVFRENIDRFNTNHLYHEGLQRLARGMLLPLLLGIIILITNNGLHAVSLVVLLASFFLIALHLLCHSIHTEEEQIARYFFTLSIEQRPDTESG